MSLTETSQLGSLSQERRMLLLGFFDRALQLAASASPRHEFLADVTGLLSEFSGCERVAILLREGERWCFWQWRRDEGLGSYDWLAEEAAQKLVRSQPSDDVRVIPLLLGHESVGSVRLERPSRALTVLDDPEMVAAMSRALAGTFVSQRAQAALRERVKELTCLYALAQLTKRPGGDLDEVMNGVVAELPPAWQYPEITAARIEIDDREWVTPGFTEGVARQRAPLRANRLERGFVEVSYAVATPELDEGPFLKEECKLIDAIARQLGQFLERRDAELERLRLQEQLRHADRLATIGQLAAGVAHEINEPLGNILGFAQLMQKNPELPEGGVHDLQRIVSACLHSREIIKKLMLFARQTPPSTRQVQLNELIEDGLFFLEARCRRNGIRVLRELEPDLAEITADPAQLQQVLVNLVVNAAQAMPEGGRLTMSTRQENGWVIVVVEDTGIGMPEEVRRQVFLPFYTTKDVDKGTGLGLAVVHGIVTAHGGSIEVDSTPNQGSRFVVRLPVAGPVDESEGGA